MPFHAMLPPSAPGGRPHLRSRPGMGGTAASERFAKGHAAGSSLSAGGGRHGRGWLLRVGGRLLLVEVRSLRYSSYTSRCLVYA